MAALEFVPGPERRGTVRERIERTLRGGRLSVDHQPIIDLHTGVTVGYEALARFAGPPEQGPAAWFDDAARVARRCELELLALRSALTTAGSLPAHCYLAVNASPDTILDPRFSATLADVRLERLVLEISEQLPIASYEQFAVAIEPWRRRGLRIAIDDVGAGFASLRHILRLRPDLLKLDRSITAEAGISAAARALAAALASFALETGATVLAEGIETETQLEILKKAGVSLGQGFLLGRPAPAAPGEGN